MVTLHAKIMRHLAVACALVVVLLSPAAFAEDDEPTRGTLQERFAPKEGRFFFHLAGTAIIRDDFYHSPGYGLDAGYHFNEVLGAELRVHNLHSSLAHAGEQLRDEYSFVPDLRAPDAAFLAGVRASWGYGKVLTLGRFVVHFDPQFLFHGGITLAEERIVPTVETGIGFLTHWQHGIQVKLDLQMSVHFERRNRGIVAATGFVPVLAVGWSPGGRPPEGGEE